MFSSGGFFILKSGHDRTLIFDKGEKVFSIHIRAGRCVILNL